MRTFVGLTAILLCGAGFVAAQKKFNSVPEAIAALSHSTVDHDAIKYLAAYSGESLPLLMQIVEHQQSGWTSASSALVRTKDASIVPFYIHLLKDNMYLKEADGSRKVFGLGSPNGCAVQTSWFGSVMARSLGEIGDKQAIPALWDATRNGDDEVRASAYGALYRLGAVSLDELFELAKRPMPISSEIREFIERLGWEKKNSDPHFALGVFDRMIAEFPDDRNKIAAAHFWKIGCYEVLHRPDDAIRECNEVLKFTEFNSLVSQAQSKLATLTEGR